MSAYDDGLRRLSEIADEIVGSRVRDERRREYGTLTSATPTGFAVRFPTEGRDLPYPYDAFAAGVLRFDFPTEMRLRETVLALGRSERAAAKEDPPDAQPPPALPEHQVRHDAAGEPHASAQRNFTDPDSRIMKQGKDFVQGYNAQAVVDDAEQVIVAAAVTNQPADAQHLPPLVAAVEENLGERPVQVLGDAGYYSAENNAFCEARGIDGLLSVRREKHVLDASRPVAPGADSRAEMRARLHTAIGKGAYSRRKCIVEPVFGQIKDARGIRSFLLRGLEQVRGEWNLVCLTHNLLKLFRFTRRSALAVA